MIPAMSQWPKMFALINDGRCHVLQPRRSIEVRGGLDTTTWMAAVS